MQAGQGGEQDNDAAEHDDHADDFVDDLDAVGTELRAHLVDEPRQSPPPEECAADDAHEPYHHLEGLVELQAEGKLGVEGHEEEDDKGIAQRDEEGRHGVVRERSLLLSGCAQLARGVCAVGIEAEAEQQEASHDLKIEAVGVVAHEVDHETHAETGNTGVDDVAQGSTATRNETIPAALVQRALYAQHAHRSHRCRGYDAYQQAFDDDVEKIWYSIDVERHNNVVGAAKVQHFYHLRHSLWLKEVKQSLMSVKSIIFAPYLFINH